MNTLYAETTGKLLTEYREVSEAILSRTEPYGKRSDQAAAKEGKQPLTESDFNSMVRVFSGRKA